MRQLWAPWRMTYILSADEATAGKCIFCTMLGEGAAGHRKNLILVEQEQAFVVMNRYPYTNGHLLVVPRRHQGDPTRLDPEHYRATCALLRDAVAALSTAVSPHGFNLGMNLGRVAGAGIDDHCHFHLVPRWNGDTNFVPLLADTRVISEHLEATYERLLPHFAPLAEVTAAWP